MLLMNSYPHITHSYTFKPSVWSHYKDCRIQINMYYKDRIQEEEKKTED